ncbi:MAG: YajQ family cyclic di-GMP-binding protein [SAR202 cluster bacterium]|nr:YajQ family cyclic di-GMP-binding protein [SAR202 cluster bacterium]
MPSFDIVSRADLAEIDNAINGMRREIAQRFDLKGTRCAVERTGNTLTLTADNDLLLRQVQELLKNQCARRKVDLDALRFGKAEDATKGSLRQQVTVLQGVDAETSKAIVKAVKASKAKVQAAVHGDEVRVSGNKRDDLQAIIALIRGLELGVPLQYVNFRD